MVVLLVAKVPKSANSQSPICLQHSSYVTLSFLSVVVMQWYLLKGASHSKFGCNPKPRELLSPSNMNSVLIQTENLASKALRIFFMFWSSDLAFVDKCEITISSHYKYTKSDLYPDSVGAEIELNTM